MKTSYCEECGDSVINWGYYLRWARFVTSVTIRAAIVILLFWGWMLVSQNIADESNRSKRETANSLIPKYEEEYMQKWNRCQAYEDNDRKVDCLYNQDLPYFRTDEGFEEWASKKASERAEAMIFEGTPVEVALLFIVWMVALLFIFAFKFPTPSGKKDENWGWILQ